MSDPVVVAKSLTVAYGATLAIKGISITAFPDEITAIVGPNGAGKTTLLETIVGLHPSRTGTIEFLGNGIDRMTVFKRRKLGMTLVAQERNIFPGMSVKENLEMGGFLVDRSTMLDRMAYVYSLFPRLEERERQMANTLSGGERRMLAIGMGIVANVKLLLIDEPSVGLAPRLVTNVLESLKTLREDTGQPVVLSEQNIKVLKIADRFLGMEAGESKFYESLDTISIDRIRELYMGLSSDESCRKEE